ncbi:MAG TPA: cell division protein FtsQ/DivIB [Solirubrobacterales bacterium]
MASSFTADVGRLARTFPRKAFEAPRALTRRRVAIAVALAALLAAGYFLWFRDSSLVAIDDVEVAGLDYAEEEVTAALEAAAEKMTTLNADPAELEEAVSGFPTVASVTIDPGFPHHLAIEVTERPPVAAIGDGEGIAVAGDGTVLSGLGAEGLKLPVIEAEHPPSSGRLDGVALAQAEVLGAAPAPLRPAIEAAGVDKEDGVVVELAEGIEVRFGDSADAAAKWASAVAILADPKLDQLSYIDVRLPGRPAVGGAPLPEPTAEEAAEAAAAAPPVAPVDPAVAPADPAAVDPAAAPVDPAATVPPADPAATTPPAAPAAPAPATGVAGGAAAP